MRVGVGGPRIGAVGHLANTALVLSFCPRTVVLKLVLERKARSTIIRVGLGSIGAHGREIVWADKHTSARLIESFVLQTAHALSRLQLRHHAWLHVIRLLFRMRDFLTP